jgi:hypothetical protein
MAGTHQAPHAHSIKTWRANRETRGPAQSGTGRPHPSRSHHMRGRRLSVKLEPKACSS